MIQYTNTSPTSTAEAQAQERTAQGRPGALVELPALVPRERGSLPKDERNMLNTREKLREAIMSALRKRQSVLMKRVHETAVQTYDDKALSAYYEIVAVSSLLGRLSDPDSSDPFMEFHRWQANGDTIYMISDDVIEMIAADLDTFIHKAVRAMCERLEYCAASVLDPDSIGFDLYNVIDLMMYDKKQKRVKQ